MPGQPPKIIIAGAPACGKGTQCEYIRDEFDVVHLSTGDMLRAAVKEGTVIGKQAKIFMERGELIPDHLIIDLVLDRVGEEDCIERGWLLDGFPRTGEQAKAIVKEGIQPDIFIHLDVPDAALVERVVGRRSDPDTGKIYHLKFSPPETEEIANRLIQRSDDTEEKVQVRVKAFHANMSETSIVFANKLVKIDGNRPPSTIWPDIRAAITRSLKWQCVFVLGGPGSGKGTQCSRISTAYDYGHLSTGDLLREEKESGSELANEINDCIKEGKLVSDEIVVRLLQSAMQKSDKSKFLIDGFPRSLANLSVWYKILGASTTVDFVLSFDCPLETMKERLIARGKTSGRADDNEETIIKRFNTFQTESLPVLRMLQLTGKVRTVSSIPPPVQVYEHVKMLFEGLKYILPYQRTLALIKPDAIEKGSEVIQDIHSRIEGVGLSVIGSKWIQLDDYTAGEFYLEHSTRDFYVKLKEFMCSGPIIVLVLEGTDAIKRWRTLMGPTNSETAREKDPNSLRALYGTDGTLNASHGSDADSSAMREIDYFFGDGSGVKCEIEPISSDLNLTGVDFCSMNTYAMIKPNASSSNYEAIKSIILTHGFKVESELRTTLTTNAAQMFYGEHKEREFFKRLVNFMTSGEVIGLRLSRVGAIKGWRHLMGPTNLKLCRETRSDSVRAYFAADGTRNGVHGSDSYEAAARELSFFFNVGGESPAVISPEDEASMSKRFTPPPAPVAHWDLPPASDAFKKKLPPLLSLRDHGKMNVYLREQVDPVVRGLIQRALINKPTNMLEWACDDLSEQKRLGAGVTLPPVMSPRIEEKPLPDTLDAAHAEILRLRTAYAAASLSGGMDSVSIVDDNSSVLTEGATATGLTHYF